MYCRQACRKAAYRARLSAPPKGSRDAWWTPAELLSGVRAEVTLGLDAAACPESTVVPGNWLGPKHPDRARRDALAWSEWSALTPPGEAVWLNPPYATSLLRRFLERAVATRDAGTPVVALIPASTGTEWWHDLVIDPGAEVRFLRGRLSFDGPHSTGATAPWPSALAFYR